MSNQADAASNHVWPQSPLNHRHCPGFSHPQMYPEQVSTGTLPYMAFPESCNMKSVARTRVTRKLLWMFCPHFFTGCSGIPFGAGCMQAPRVLIAMLRQRCWSHRCFTVESLFRPPFAWQWRRLPQPQLPH